jgi:hypothetical protein
MAHQSATHNITTIGTYLHKVLYRYR